MSEAEKKILTKLLANNQRALKRLYARLERLKKKKKFSISFSEGINFTFEVIAKQVS